MMNDYENVQEQEVWVAPVSSNIMVLPYEENPYLQKTTETGLKMTDGQFDNPDSGDRDQKDQFIRCGRVIGTGPECKFVQEGDDIFFDKRSARPVPFFDKGFLIMAEGNLICVINTDVEARLAEARAKKS